MIPKRSWVCGLLIPSRLGVTYNALRGPRLRENFAAWAQAEYPNLWEPFWTKKKGTKVGPDGLIDLRIRRIMKA